MANKTKLIFAFLITLAVAISFISALSVIKVDQAELHPGDEASISITIENNLNKDVDNVVLNLNFEKIPMIPIGSSEDNVDEIKEDDDEKFNFNIKAANDASAGNYEIPYTLTYEQGNQTFTKTGTIGVTIKANPIIDVSYEIENNIVGSKGRVDIKIINKGLYEARFVNLKVDSSGLTVLSDSLVYIGQIDSDDFDTASFDVIFNNKNPTLNLEIEYLDFDNNKQTLNEQFNLRAYTQEEAIQKGIISKNNSSIYLVIVIVLLLIWFIYRKIRKNKKKAVLNGNHK